MKGWYVAPGFVMYSGRNFFGIPEGYIPGADRASNSTLKTHLYKGTFDNPGLPMCKNGWNRDSGRAYSIWRNNIGPNFLCWTCVKRARAGKGGKKARK